MSFFKSLSRFVGLLTRTTALPVGAAPDGTPIHTVVFPDTGGAQIVDATGTVSTVATTSGSTSSLAVTDANNAGIAEIPVQHKLTAPGLGAAGVGVGLALQAPNAAGTLKTGLQVDVAFSSTVAGSENIAGVALSVMNAGTLTEVIDLDKNGNVIPQIPGTQSLGGPGAEWQSISLGTSAEVGTASTHGARLGAGGPSGVVEATGPAADADLLVKAKGSGNVTLAVGSGGGVSLGNDALSKVGFYNVAPIARQSVNHTTATLDDLITTLSNCGIILRT